MPRPAWGKLAERLLETSGAAGLELVITGLAGLAEAGEAGPDMVRAFERAEPALFGAVRRSPTSPTTRARSSRRRSGLSASPVRHLPKGYGWVASTKQPTGRPMAGVVM
ncbi:MAG: hypothetical protein R3C69_12695 [Geminicoccaceae bacterium]